MNEKVASHHVVEADFDWAVWARSDLQGVAVTEIPKIVPSK